MNSIYRSAIYARVILPTFVVGLALAGLLVSLSTVESKTASVLEAPTATTVLDANFAAGVTEGNIGSYSSAVQPDGKVLIGGGFSLVNGVQKNTLVRVDTAGAIDIAFNSGGAGPNGSVYGIIVMPDGKILIAGTFSTYNGAPISGVTRLNSDGTMDTTFNPGGAGTTGVVQGLSLQTDGKILISSGALTAYNGTPTSRIARLNTDGSFDTTFVSPFSTSGFVEEIRQQPDGKILISGSFSLNGKNNIARLNSDGSEDTSFLPSGGGTDNGVFGLAFQPDGKILIGGAFGMYNGVARARGARLNADGSLDTTFNPPPVTGPGAEYFNILPDGKILVAGGFDDGTDFYSLVRLNPDGSPDQTWTDVYGNHTGYNISRQADGKIILVGLFSSINDQDKRTVVRLNADGTTDNSFNVSAVGFGYVAAMAQQPDGKIIATGNFNFANGVGRKMIARFNLDGTLDTSFNGGFGTFPDSFNGGNIINAIAVQPNGKIIIGGNFGGFNGVASRGIARLNADGTPDSTFSAVHFNALQFNAIVNDVCLQSDGKVMVGGVFTAVTGSVPPQVYRLNADGTNDTAFAPLVGNNGTVQRIIQEPSGMYLVVGAFTNISGAVRNRIARLNVNGAIDPAFDPGTGFNGGNATAIAQQMDGKTVVGGAFTSFNGTNINRIARLNPNGTLDTSFNPGTGANGTVETVSLLPDGKLIVGGRFSTFNDAANNRLVRLQANGPIDPTFTSEFNSDPRFFVKKTIVQLDGSTLVGGLFIEYGGQQRNAILRLRNVDSTTGGDQPILFTSNRYGNNDIFRMNADGTNQQQLTTATEAESGARWSPDGTKIAYTKVVAQFTRQVWTMNADGSNKTLISSATGYNEMYKWSPNGLKILYGVSPSTTSFNLWIMNSDGSNKLQLTSGTDFDHFANWAPDGTRVAFGRCNGTTFICDVYRINADGTGLTNLTPGHADDDDAPSWIDNGNRIVFTRGGNADGFFDLFVMNSDGSNLQRLTNTTLPIANYLDGGVSPNGQKIAFGRFNTTGSGGQQIATREILTMNLDGTSQVNLTNNTTYDLYSIWSKDSSKIAFRSRRDTAMDEAYVMNSDGTGVVRLTSNFANDFITDWKSVQAPSAALFDYDGDGLSDVSVFRPSDNNWYVQNAAGFSVRNFGAAGDVAVPADYDGDGKTDIAVWRPSNGHWYLHTGGGAYQDIWFGENGDLPLPGDHDGDEKADLVVYRPSNGTWYKQLSTAGFTVTLFGAAGDKPVLGDFDGDGKADNAVFRSSTNTWYFLNANGFSSREFGAGGDIPVPADYDGDGTTDVAVFRPSTGQWYWFGSSDGFRAFGPWGVTGDTPVPADYDGDGKADPSVFRPSDSGWYIFGTASGFLGRSFGQTGDKPTPNVFVY